MVGAGFVTPIQDTGNYLTTSWVFQVGGGRNFNKRIGVLLQFDYNDFGFQGKTLANQQALYNSFCTPADQFNGLCAPITVLGGSSHVWSFTLDPTYTFYDAEKMGAYVVAGVGFYHKTADFTTPVVQTACDPFYGCIQYQANQTVDDYTSNAVGFDGGLGLTYKPSRFSGQKLYVEARYVFMDNSARPATVTNLYPPNANQTYYIPVTFGLRF
jgi:opacity protein-like surface antigen